MSTPNNVRLCEPSAKLDDDWRQLYSSAFPLSEQEPEEKLQQLIDAGRLLYHKTVGKNGELLCFSMVSLAPEFSFLAYIATDPKQRSGGYGSKHMRALIDLLKNQYPSHLGLFLEIESTNPRLVTLSDEEKDLRNRRLNFYRRLGSKRLCRNMHYVVPNRTGDGEQELDILYLGFHQSELAHQQKNKIVTDILQRFYLMDACDALLTKVLSTICSCSQATCEDDPVDPVQ